MAQKTVQIESLHPRRIVADPKLKSCSYCGAMPGQACEFVALPGMTVASEWAHRAREEAVSRVR